MKMRKNLDIYYLIYLKQKIKILVKDIYNSLHYTLKELESYQEIN